MLLFSLLWLSRRKHEEEQSISFEQVLCEQSEIYFMQPETKFLPLLHKNSFVTSEGLLASISINCLLLLD